MRNANCRDAPRHLRRTQSKDRATGEPDDAKVSSPVRRGADGKGRSRLPVTADAYGLTNPGIRRNLASRLPYVRWTICNLIPFAKRRLSGHESGSSVLPTAERHEEP